MRGLNDMQIVSKGDPEKGGGGKGGTAAGTTDEGREHFLF